jgi:hypothetical protein
MAKRAMNRFEERTFVFAALRIRQNVGGLADVPILPEIVAGHHSYKGGIDHHTRPTLT